MKFRIQLLMVMVYGIGSGCYFAYQVWTVRDPSRLASLVVLLIMIAVTARCIWKLRRTTDAQFVREERQARDQESEWVARHPTLMKWLIVLFFVVMICNFYILWNDYLR